jgi:hypothetical protein
VPEMAVPVLNLNGQRWWDWVLAAARGRKVSAQPFRAAEDANGFEKAGGNW